VLLARPTRHFFRQLTRRHASELEIYQRLGFPDGFSGDAVEGQSLLFGVHEVVLVGGRVLGLAHGRNQLEWDGVPRPRSFREFQARVRALAPLVPSGTPLYKAIAHFDLTSWDAADDRWPRLVKWWALSRLSNEAGLNDNLREAFRRMPGSFALRLAAELVSPSVAAEVLVALGHWPPSDTRISAARFHAAIRLDWLDGYRVICVVTGQDLGSVASVRAYGVALLAEEYENFADDQHATSCALGLKGDHALTGDGDVWRREGAAWSRCGPAATVLIAMPPAHPASPHE
jgi:hypothetical protein